MEQIVRFHPNSSFLLHFLGGIVTPTFFTSYLGRIYSMNDVINSCFPSERSEIHDSTKAQMAESSRLAHFRNAELSKYYPHSAFCHGCMRQNVSRKVRNRGEREKGGDSRWDGEDFGNTLGKVNKNFCRLLLLV